MLLTAATTSNNIEQFHILFSHFFFHCSFLSSNSWKKGTANPESSVSTFLSKTHLKKVCHLFSVRLGSIKSITCITARKSAHFLWVINSETLTDIYCFVRLSVVIVLCLKMYKWLKTRTLKRATISMRKLFTNKNTFF